MLDFLFSTLFISLIVISLILIGAMASIPAWLPPVRRLCWRSPTAQRFVICLLACVSLAVSFGLCTKMSAEIDYAFRAELINDFNPETPPFWPSQDQVKYQPAVIRELWRRYRMPPLLRDNCYSPVAIVCELADQVMARPAYQAWKQYWITLGLSLITVAAYSSLVWLATRKRVAHVPETLADSS